jgi:hypothetical protein
MRSNRTSAIDDLRRRLYRPTEASDNFIGKSAKGSIEVPILGQVSRRVDLKRASAKLAMVFVGTSPLPCLPIGLDTSNQLDAIIKRERWEQRAYGLVEAFISIIVTGTCYVVRDLLRSTRLRGAPRSSPTQVNPISHEARPKSRVQSPGIHFQQSMPAVVPRALAK